MSKRLEKDLYGFTVEEALNKDIPQTWEVRKDLWGHVAADGPPKIIQWSQGNEDNATIHLDVTNCNQVITWAHCEWHGIFSAEPTVIEVGNTSGGTYSTNTVMKFNYGSHYFQVPKNAKYWNYRITSYGSGTSNRPIMSVKI
tara:strand:+ start:231 stop:656 length:426 start_codon:yes stop_codon:yes gene_type:complete